MGSDFSISGVLSKSGDAYDHDMNLFPTLIYSIGPEKSNVLRKEYSVIMLDSGLRMSFIRLAMTCPSESVVYKTGGVALAIYIFSVLRKVVEYVSMVVKGIFFYWKYCDYFTTN